jgi:hypothetical protein
MKVDDVVCPFCGCLCDDLVVEVEGERVIGVENGCTLAQEKFMGDRRLEHPIKRQERTGHLFLMKKRSRPPQRCSWRPTAPCSMAGAGLREKPRVWAFTWPNSWER